MKHKFILLSLFMITLFPLYSQTNGRLWGGLEVGYGLSLADKGKMYDLSYGRDAKMTISTIKAVLGYYITPRLSLGAGIGLSSYTLPGVNTAPLCIDIRYHPVRDNLNIVLNGDIGYSLATSESDTKGKFMADFSLGYKLFNIKKINITPAIGYNYINYSVDNVFGKSNQSRHSIFMKIGILY